MKKQRHDQICSTDHPAQCRRAVRWKVGEIKLGRVVYSFFCNCCFDKWTEHNWDKFEPEMIERLSDNERDFEFVARNEPLCRVPCPIEQ